ncbi:MAG TPA: exodeoxyribonuclease V subunit gamma [Vulgatibacter sp.]|nr:exodeoxyribonuclease V subunit gamma [Vulgatibacter sp.]
MIRLTYSNRTEKLLDALAADLSAAAASGRSPFEPVRVVVPNRNVETWLRHGLARRLGIAANLEVQQLRRFVGELLRKTLPDTRLVDGEILLDLVLSCLLDERRLEHPAFSRIRSYLHAAGADAAARDLRRYQLAAELARLFDEYGHSRPEMIGAWPREGILAGTPQEETEAWQRKLWLELFGGGGLAEERARAAGEQWWTLPQLLDRIGEIELGKESGPIHVLGISYVASAFHRIFARLAQDTELFVYALNPCMEFWEDVEASHEARARLSRRIRLGPERLAESTDPFHLEDGGDTPALSLWGKPGRENVRLLNELAQCDFRAVFEELGEERPSLLRQLQQDILVREPERKAPDPSFDFRGDDSVRILACPGVRREVETIAESIWELVHRDAVRGGGEPLRFNDIAVLVAGADPEAYFTHLAAVFEETWGIPFNRTGTSFRAESRIAEAVDLLLGLPGGRATRAEVLDFVTHPNGIAAHPDADPAEWARWCERLGIVRGHDREDLADSYVEDDLLSWDQGLRRMALGAFLEGEEAFDVGPSSYLPASLPDDALASFGASIRRLLDDVEGARSRRLPTAEWARVFAEMAERHVVPRGEAEERDLDRALRALRGIGDLGLGGAEVGYPLALQLARRALQGIGGAKGQYLAGGVVVSTLQPMRAIPFRAIFVAGLGEGRFPAADRLDHLDLRLARPRVGDVSQREGDQYMFLEAILCAREHLFLSYVARDQLTGESLRPSTVLAELERMLVRGYGASDLVREIPLRRFDAPAPFASPQAMREARTVALREDLRRRLPAGGGIPGLDEILAALAPGSRDALADHLGIDGRRGNGAGTIASPLQPDGRAVSISLRQLRGFLECPAQGSAEILLGLRRDEEGGVESVEDESFDVPRLAASIMLRDVFLGVAREATGPLEAERIRARWEEAAREARLGGRFPLGIFADAARDEHLLELEAWRETANAIAGDAAAGLEVVRFGPAVVEDESDRVVDRIALEVRRPDGRKLAVELHGATEPLLGDGRHVLVLATPKKAETVARQKFGLRGWLTHLALAASGVVGGGATRTVHFCPAADGKTMKPMVLAAIGQDEALATLRILVGDLLGSIHDYLLPCEAVFAAKFSRSPSAVEEKIQELRSPFKTCSSLYGPLRGVIDFPVPDGANELVERRFGPYFAAQSEPARKRGKR